MALTGTDLINGPSGARVTLIDAAKVTWSDVELLGYLNEGIRATVFLKPDTNVVRDYVTLAAGDRQELPAGGVAVLDVLQNSVAKGGRNITQVDESLLDECNRFWPAGTRVPQVEHYTADPRDPRRFRVFPPNDGTGSVEVMYGALPTPIAAIGDAVPMSDSYQAALIAFVLSKAYAKNSTKQDLGKSDRYVNQWQGMLGVKSKAQFAVAPKVSQEPGA
jgi:hypothetical protein